MQPAFPLKDEAKVRARDIERQGFLLPDAALGWNDILAEIDHGRSLNGKELHGYDFPDD